jgi:hypothetical protein
MTLTDEINRLKADIENLKAAIAADPTAGRFIRALQARELEYGKRVTKRAMIELARPLPRRTLSDGITARVDMTADERAWLEGRAPAPIYLDKPGELAAMRELYWRTDAKGHDVLATDRVTH